MKIIFFGPVTRTLGNESVIPETFGNFICLESSDFDAKWLRTEIGNFLCGHVHAVVTARSGVIIPDCVGFLPMENHLLIIFTKNRRSIRLLCGRLEI